MKVTKKVSVKELLISNKLKEGDRLKLKCIADCENKYPSIIKSMNTHFDTYVTFSCNASFYDEYMIQIKEDCGYYIWNVDWFCDVEFNEEIILDFKEALERSMYVWEYMIDNDCKKTKANKDLYNIDEMYGECFLCDSLGGKRNSLLNRHKPNCIKCVNWSKKNPNMKYSQICVNNDSYYNEYHQGNYTEEVKKKILNFLKKEYIRLYGLKLLKKNSPKLYRFLLKKNILDIYFSNLIKNKVQILIKGLKSEKTIINSFGWFNSNEGSGYWLDLSKEFDEYPTSPVNKEVDKEYYTFTDTDIDFNQVCNDSLEDKKVSFLIKGKEKAYVGLLNSGEKVGVPIMIGDFFKNNGLDSINYIQDLPYGVFEIPLNRVDSWREKLRNYSVNYEKWRSDLNKNIKDRGRQKEKNRFKVYQY